MRQRAEIDPTLEARVEELLCCMTLEEKAAQMVQVPYSMVPKEEALEWAKRGAGSFLHVLGDDAREVQDVALHTRLGIPVLFGIDAIHGHGLNEKATIFPTQLAAACSWNPELIEEMGRITAREVATDGLHWTFSPVLCLGRDARWGRVGETFGEDPFLAGELGAAIIRGYQGERLDDNEHILACAKHYIGYGEAVGARDACDTEMTFRKLREVFLPPFERAVAAGCATVMTAYGSIDGTPFTASEKTLKTILRKELGFDGFVVTDWDNVNNLVERQYVARDMDEASQLAAEAGNDMIMTSAAFYESAIRLVRTGKMPERVLDDAVRNILRIKFRMGLFEQPEKRGVPGCLGCEAHLEASKALARESVVLLKNDGVLPLDTNMKKIAVIGPNADDIRAQYGDWTYFTHPIPNPDHAPMRPYVNVLEGVRELAEELGVEVVYQRGCGVLETPEDDLDTAVEMAKGCGAILLVLGDCVEQAGEFRDRADLALSGRQEELFLRLKALGTPMITVLVATKPLCFARVAEGSGAVMVAFNGGMFSGLAVAEAVFGRLNPCGKLPISFPRHTGQIPVYYNSLPGWHGGKYVDLPAEALFAFGEGLSYTRFACENLRFDEQTLTLAVSLTNAGARRGTETTQVYVRDLVSSVITPVKRLIAFQKVTLDPGETRDLVFRLKREDFSLVLPDERRVVERGEFRLFVGGSSKDEDLLSLGTAIS
ncbi:MAG TPA: glycoside hydrolase family 3 N-terminal domain-containing protein [Feifaniaceae bacterium]|nr:glycoside hydrolase family 3 N-terminal domain-containing protein [Feifaniaceae bacterium]